MSPPMPIYMRQSPFRTASIKAISTRVVSRSSVDVNVCVPRYDGSDLCLSLPLLRVDDWLSNTLARLFPNEFRGIAAKKETAGGGGPAVCVG